MSAATWKTNSTFCLCGIRPRYLSIFRQRQGVRRRGTTGARGGRGRGQAQRRAGGWCCCHLAQILSLARSDPSPQQNNSILSTRIGQKAPDVGDEIEISFGQESTEQGKSAPPGSARSHRRDDIVADLRFLSPRTLQMHPFPNACRVRLTRRERDDHGRQKEGRNLRKCRDFNRHHKSVFIKW